MIVNISFFYSKDLIIKNQINLKKAFQFISTRKLVDLTHSFAPGIPHWPGFPDEKREILYWYDEGVGTLGTGPFAEQFTLVGQWGTHVDAPAHLYKGLRTIDRITLDEMILPLVVIDIHEEVKNDPDYSLQLNKVHQWEEEHGKIQEGAFVALRTDWYKRWPDPDAMANKDEDGIPHYPGWGLEALKYLYEVRNITASGHETTDTDPGISVYVDNFTCERYILSRNCYQVEMLKGLDKVPETGAIIIVGFPKPLRGSGFPARVFAIKP